MTRPISRIQWICLLLIGALIAALLLYKFSGKRTFLSPSQTQQWVEPSSQEIEKVHLALKQQEKQEIEAFVARCAWRFKETETGLYYQIYKKNPKGAVVEKGNAVKITYTLQLLNGRCIGSSQLQGPKEWIVGQSPVEAGLNELVLKMKRGEKARGILPSHLAYGLSGNGDQIPARASLFYDIEIKAVYIRATLK